MKHDDLYRPHANQLKIHLDQSRYRVVVAGRRFGKSALAINEALVRLLGRKRQLIWIILPYYKQAKQIYWTDPDVLKFFMPYVHAGIITKNDSELSLYCPFTESRIQLKGADNENALRGSGIDLIIWDEAADVETGAFNTVEASLADSPNHRVLYIGTPRGYNHFHELALLGDHNHLFPTGGKDITPLDDWNSWHFTSYDNLAWPEGSYERKRFVEFLDAQKAQKATEWFEQEYMARFSQFTGAVYKEFQRETHVLEPFDVPDSWQIYRGLDFGSTNPTACLWIAVDGDDNWYVIDEHYQTGETIDFHAGVINAKTQRSITATYGDPSGAQWINEFAQRGIYITPATKETGQNSEGWVRFGIEKVAERLKLVPGHAVPTVRNATLDKDYSGMPKLFVFSTCTNTIKEFETYRWKERKETQAQDLNMPDQPEKANDHAMDALRYFAVSYKRLDENWDHVNDGLSTKWRL